jgi:hypothetical protein
MEILGFPFLGSLLREYVNKYEHPREKLIVLVHWTFLSRNFLISKDGEVRRIFLQSQLINVRFFRIRILWIG